jgi:hypothetical protein
MPGDSFFQKILFTDIKTEFDNIAGAHDVFFAFGAHFASSFGGNF